MIISSVSKYILNFNVLGFIISITAQNVNLRMNQETPTRRPVGECFTIATLLPPLHHPYAPEYGLTQICFY